MSEMLNFFSSLMTGVLHVTAQGWNMMSPEAQGVVVMIALAGAGYQFFLRPFVKLGYLGARGLTWAGPKVLSGLATGLNHFGKGLSWTGQKLGNFRSRRPVRHNEFENKLNEVMTAKVNKVAEAAPTERKMTERERVEALIRQHLS